ncbi:hypothetical protein [Dechloromonas sp. A34]|uniref:hypothetical protein n=1 Tax=Dechloromonas sp. A34 TaxID=447588 RepID=UPI0022497FDF|nr:hypothetical protein [Dechloromonas sp. A34]
MKGLVETRARADAESNRLSHLIESLTLKLTKTQDERDSCDHLIASLNNQIQPGQIEPINAWQGRYGKRGAFRQAILKAITLAYPHPISTTEIAQYLQATFNLIFAIPSQRKIWVHNSINTRLRELANSKSIQRIHDPLPISAKQASGYGFPQTWRPLTCRPSLHTPASLR